MVNSNDPKERAAAAKMAVFWPNQADRGAHVNISGAALTRSSKHREAAIKLIEFLATEESQQWYAEANGEYPVRADVAVGKTLKAWGEFTSDSLNLGRLGELNSAALMLMDRAGWK
jgi:iron(III) transport system substrate-binding protein